LGSIGHLRDEGGAQIQQIVRFETILAAISILDCEAAHECTARGRQGGASATDTRGGQHEGNARIGASVGLVAGNRPTRPEVFSMRCFAEIPRTESPPKEESKRFLSTRALR